MFPILNLGPLVLPTAGLLYLLGIWLCLSVVERAAKWLHQDVAAIYNLAVTMLVAGFVGARLVFVAIYWTAYADNLLGIIWPLNSGFHLWGGLFFGLVAGVLYGRFHQLPLLSTLDTLTPALITAFMIISLSDFLAGPGFGDLTSLPWGITQFGVRRHPVQLYELLGGGVAWLTWWQSRPISARPGQLFYVTLAIYSGGRLFTDAFRENAWLTADGLHTLQILCLITMLACLYLLGQSLATDQLPD